MQLENGRSASYLGYTGTNWSIRLSYFSLLHKCVRGNLVCLKSCNILIDWNETVSR